MNRKVALLLVAVFVISIIPPGYGQGVTKVYVNGVKQQVTPLVKDGVVYLPATPMAMSLGITISWDSSSRILKVNGKVVGASPLEMDGKLYLPLESIASSAGATVEWDGASQAVKITKAGAPSVAAVDSSSPTPTPVIAASPETPKPAVTQPATATGPSPDVVSAAAPKKSYAVSIPSVKAPESAMAYVPPAKTAPPEAYQPNLPASAVTQPSGNAYAAEGLDRKDPLQPTGGAPKLPSNLTLPPLSMIGSDYAPPEVTPTMNKFIPKSESNNVFRITVTNIEYVDCIKDYYKAKPDYKYVVVYLSQQNISEAVQVYTGRFSLLDRDNTSYDYIEGLSNFWLVILRPNGINFGYLVFEIPNKAKPNQLVLHGLNKQAPLIVGLR